MLMNNSRLEMERGCYQVQVGVFRNKIFGEQLMIELQQGGYPSYMEYDESAYYVVKVGDYKALSEAIQMEQKLKREGYSTIIVTS